MDEVATNIRKLVIDTLELLESKEKQLEYQQKVPYADVSSELFCRWDGAYIPDSPHNGKAFTAEELSALNAFNQIFEKVSESTPENLPPIEDFIKTSDWQQLRDAAETAIIKCSFRRKKD